MLTLRAMKLDVPHYISRKDIDELESLTAPVPENEFQRIRVLRESNILKTKRDDINLDKYTILASAIYKVQFFII